MHKILFITILVALASFTNAATTTPAVNLVVTYPNGHGQFQYGDAVTYTTSVAPVGNGTTTPPTGTVNVFADGQQRATCQLLSSPPTNIVCAVSETMTPPLTVGPHNFTSFYLGDQNYNPADSGVQTLRVVAVPTITISVSPSNPTVAQAVTVTIATTATNPPNQASQPTGTVTFTANGNQLGTCTLTSGGCTFTIPANTLTQGSVTLVGGYGGDTTFAPVNVSTTFTVGVATTATTASTTSTTASTVATATTAGTANNGATASTATTTGSDTNGAAATATTASTTGATTQTGASTQLNNGGSTAFTGTTSGAITVCGSVFLTLLAAAVAL